MEKDSGSNPENTEIQKKRDVYKKNIFVLIGVFILVVIITLLIGCKYIGESDYDKGAKYCKEKKFTEALYEFQKVDPDNINFNNAQSKINYINGLQSFNDGKMAEAIVYLSKVLSNDEYYHDSQLILEKINGANMGNNLQSQIDSLKNKKDTVIIKREVNHEKKKDPIDPNIKADLELSRKFASEIENSISRFENQYQSARTSPVNTKSDYGKKLESIDKEFNNLKYLAQNKNAGVIELKKLTSEWMSKRIALIRQLASEKTISETTNISRSLKEEGDSQYIAMMSQLKKVKKSLR
jgi:hypothetical protein